MISSMEDEFHTQLDLPALDAEQITVLGSLCQYVAENAPHVKLLKDTPLVH